MRRAALLLWLTLVWPPGPLPAPCGVIPDNDAPWWRISLGDNPQWLPCDVAPSTPTPAPADYPVRAWIPVMLKG